MDQSPQFRTVWRYRWLLLLVALAAGVAAYALSSSRSSVYQATARAQVIPGEQTGSSGLTQEQLVDLNNIYTELAQTTAVVDRARRLLGLRIKAAKFKEDLGVSAPKELGVLDFTADSHSPRRAATYANAYAQAFTDYVSAQENARRARALQRIQARTTQIQQQLRARPRGPRASALGAELTALQTQAADTIAAPSDHAQIVERATPPTVAQSPKPKRDALLGFLAVLVLGAALVYLRASMTDRYQSAEEAASDLGLPMLGRLPKAEGADPEAREAFRGLRTNLAFALLGGREGVDRFGSERAVNGGPGEAARHATGTSRRGLFGRYAQPRTGQPLTPASQPAPRPAEAASAEDEGQAVLVTSPKPAAGKTYVVSNLVRAFAAEGRWALALDADLHDPGLHRAFDVPVEPGLSDALASSSRQEVKALVREAPLPEPDSRRGGRLAVLPAGPGLEDAGEALAGARAGEVVRELRRAHDFTVVDSPPALSVVDPVLLSRHVHGVVLVFDARRTSRREARQCVRTLRAVDAPLLGFVFNRTETAHAPYGYYRPAERAAATAEWEPVR